jgi:hypothetical protein
VIGPCVTAMIDAVAAGTSEAKTGATVSPREVDIDITFGCERDGGEKIFGRRGYEASGSELTAIHEGVDVALCQRFFQTVLRGALGNEIILVLE